MAGFTIFMIRMIVVVSCILAAGFSRASIDTSTDKALQDYSTHF